MSGRRQGFNRGDYLTDQELEMHIIFNQTPEVQQQRALDNFKQRLEQDPAYQKRQKNENFKQKLNERLAEKGETLVEVQNLAAQKPKLNLANLINIEKLNNNLNEEIKFSLIDKTKTTIGLLSTLTAIGAGLYSAYSIFRLTLATKNAIQAEDKQEIEQSAKTHVKVSSALFGAAIGALYGLAGGIKIEINDEGNIKNKKEALDQMSIPGAIAGAVIVGSAGYFTGYVGTEFAKKIIDVYGNNNPLKFSLGSCGTFLIGKNGFGWSNESYESE